MSLSTKFDFQSVEKKWRKVWEDQNLFHAEPDPEKTSYAIVIPPPNVTGILHMGHALNNTLQDILIRYKRMNGFSACWMPGTDHAGIATQNVVEKHLAKEGKTRHDVGRDALLERLWEWKREYGDTIIHQLKTLGASCDWPRTRFTMDDDYSIAVREVFIRLYEKGLIYRGNRIINWCPRCRTALSDEEAEHQEHQGALYHIRYPLADNPNRYLVVATTRPETMLGDSGVAVHPKDERYQDVIGKTLRLPILNREIPVVTDEFVDPAFGTGAVKVTPAHDPNDFDMGLRHNLEFINVMHPDGRMNDLAGDYAGMDRFEAREALINELKDLKLFEKIEPHTHAVGHCYRCHTVVEPYLSQQWFVKMKPLAGPALAAVTDGRITFHPDRWTKVYTNWMENIRDWCISRQIWWGHRIPVWYCENKKGKGKGEKGDDGCPPVVARETPAACPHCGGKSLIQDEDVLDTWFSSWLWPFATFGWPPDSEKGKGEGEKDLAYFYPGDALLTASEIIFFWVARMIMAGCEFMGDIPFKDVYIHGTVRDTQGRKMSKSLGNAIDPLEIIRDYGADALRFSLILNSGQDLYISKEKFETGRNFANKIWNASRLVLMNMSTEARAIDLTQLPLGRMDLASRWIVSKLYSTLDGVSTAIEAFRFSEAENLIYDFFWRCYCDWYLEMSKNRFNDPLVQQVSFAVLERAIRMMHPFIPFVTEEIWEQLQVKEGALCRQDWPKSHSELIDPQAETAMQTFMNVVTSIRNLRVLWNIKPQQTIACRFAVSDPGEKQLLKDTQGEIQSLLKINNLTFIDEITDVTNAAAGVVGTIKFSLPLGDIIDIETEKTRLASQLNDNTKAWTALSQRLQNEQFLSKAPADVVAKEKERLADLNVKIGEIEEMLKNFGDSGKR